MLDQFARESKFQHLAPTVRATKKPPAMAPKKASSKADEAAKVALLAEKKGKTLALVDTTHQEATEDDALSKRQRNEQPTPEGSLRTCSSGGQPQPPLGFAPPEGVDVIEDGEVIGVSAEEQLQLRALRIKNCNLQKQKEILEAKRQRVSAQAKVRQMIRDEEQKAQELEQEIALMQREGHLGLQPGPPLQQRAQVEDLYFPQRGHAIPHAVAFQGVNYLDEQSPLAPHLQVTPWPANFRAGTYPKYNGSTDPAQYIMSYQVAVASSRRDDATMAKSFIIALEGPALTWYTRLPPLSIDSWRSLRDKFLLNFQGYRPDTDALAELSLYK
jgi:DNA-binding transcriptional MerR regulator